MENLRLLLKMVNIYLLAKKRGQQNALELNSSDFGGSVMLQGMVFSVFLVLCPLDVEATSPWSRRHSPWLGKMATATPGGGSYPPGEISPAFNKITYAAKDKQRSF
jgi:hypothetical protein